MVKGHISEQLGQEQVNWLFVAHWANPFLTTVLFYISLVLGLFDSFFTLDLQVLRLYTHSTVEWSHAIDVLDEGHIEFWLIIFTWVDGDLMNESLQELKITSDKVQHSLGVGQYI